MASEPYSAIEPSLIAKTQSGDEAAFTKILQRYQRPVLDFVYRMLGNADTAQDVAQEVFVRVLAGMQPNSDFARVFPNGGVILVGKSCRREHVGKSIQIAYWPLVG